jgi:hypothetical protein
MTVHNVEESSISEMGGDSVSPGQGSSSSRRTHRKPRRRRQQDDSDADLKAQIRAEKEAAVAPSPATMLEPRMSVQQAGMQTAGDDMSAANVTSVARPEREEASVSSNSNRPLPPATVAGSPSADSSKEGSHAHQSNLVGAVPTRGRAFGAPPRPPASQTQVGVSSSSVTGGAGDAPSVALSEEQELRHPKEALALDAELVLVDSNMTESRRQNKSKESGDRLSRENMAPQQLQQERSEEYGGVVAVAKRKSWVTEAPRDSGFSKRLKLFIIAVVVLLAILAGVAIFFLKSARDGDAKSTDTTPAPSTPVPVAVTTVPTRSHTDPPTEFLQYDPPTPEDCQAIATGGTVTGQSNMLMMSFTMDLDIRLTVSVGSDEINSEMEELIEKIQSVLVPEMAGCDVGNRRWLQEEGGVRGSSRSLVVESARYMIANGITAANQAMPCEGDNSGMCYRVNVNLDLFLRGNENKIFAVISMILEVVGEEDELVQKLGLVLPLFDQITLVGVNSNDPTDAPSTTPTVLPSASPTLAPTKTASAKPTGVPSAKPTGVPSTNPSVAPSVRRTPVPTPRPTTKEPSAAPIATIDCEVFNDLGAVPYEGSQDAHYVVPCVGRGDIVIVLTGDVDSCQVDECLGSVSYSSYEEGCDRFGSDRVDSVVVSLPGDYSGLNVAIGQLKESETLPIECNQELKVIEREECEVFNDLGVVPYEGSQDAHYVVQCVGSGDIVILTGDVDSCQVDECLGSVSYSSYEEECDRFGSVVVSLPGDYSGWNVAIGQLKESETLPIECNQELKVLEREECDDFENFVDDGLGCDFDCPCCHCGGGK